MLPSKSCADEQREEVCMPRSRTLGDKQAGKGCTPRSQSRCHEEMHVVTYFNMSKILSKIHSIIVLQVTSQIMINYHSKIAAQMLPRSKSLYDKQTRESSCMLRSKSLWRKANVCITWSLQGTCA